jgi:hypothetical protein
MPSTSLLSIYISIRKKEKEEEDEERKKILKSKEVRKRKVCFILYAYKILKNPFDFCLFTIYMMKERIFLMKFPI